MRGSLRCLLVALSLSCLWKLIASEEIFVLYQRGFLYRYKAFSYEAGDLVSSVALGKRCERFVQEETQTFGVDGYDEDETKPHAVNVCKQVAAKLNLPYEPEAYYSKKHEEERARYKLILDFMTNGWFVGQSILPELNDPNITGSILQSLKMEKFNRLIRTLQHVRKKWDLKEDITIEGCGEFDEGALILANEKSDDSEFDILYKDGITFIRCITLRFSSEDELFTVLKPFDRYMNIHRSNPEVYRLAKSEELVLLAATALQTNTLRLYGTTLHLKDPTTINIETTQRRDLSRIPLDTRDSGSLTIWCPLSRKLTMENGDSLLQFVGGSHRDMSREHWFDTNSVETVTFGQAISLDVGDCTLHHGWIKYFAPPQRGMKQRLALSFTYVTGEAIVLNDLPALTSNRYVVFDDEDKESYIEWLKDLEDGQEIDHPLLPQVLGQVRVVQPKKNTVKRKFDELSPSKILYETFG